MELLKNATEHSNHQKKSLVGGWAKVYRKDWEYPTYVTVEFNEVAQTKGSGELNSNWANKGRNNG